MVRSDNNLKLPLDVKADVKKVEAKPPRKHAIMFPPYSKSKVRPEFAAECDINNIVAKFKKTGLLTHVRTYQGQYGDFSSMPDYHEAMNIILAAEDMFATVPSDIRAKFSNDPAKFLEFVQNPLNREEMDKMGLLTGTPKKSLGGDLNAINEVSGGGESPTPAKA